MNGTTFDSARYEPAVAIAGGVTIFSGAPSGGGTSRLWKTDGTPSGTTTVTSTANVFGYGAAWNGKALFEGVGSALWIADGTSAGTKIVKSFYGMRGVLALSGTKASAVGSTSPHGTSEGTKLSADIATGRRTRTRICSASRARRCSSQRSTRRTVANYGR